MRLPARRGGGGVLLAAALALGALTGPTAGAAAPSAPGPAPAPATPSMALVSQTPFLAAPGDFTLRLHIDRPADPGAWEVAATVYPAVATRSEFDVTLGDKATEGALLPVQVFPVAGLATDANGEASLVLHLTDRLSLGHDDGVFPVRVELRERSTGRLVRRFTTYVLWLPATHNGARLGVSLVLPLHEPAGLAPSGARKAPALDDLAAQAAALDALRTTPYALAPTPETLATLAAATDDRAVATLKGLQVRAAATTVLAGTYVPTNLPGLLGAGLAKDAGTQVTRGASTVADTLRLRPDARTWLAWEPLDEASLSLLASRGVDRVVATEADVAPLTGQRLTPTSPFVLAAGSRQVPAAVADAGLAADFDNVQDPVLAANHLLADLAVIYLDRPGAERRAVVAAGPPSWRMDRAFLDAVAAGLASNPIVEPMSLDTLFASVAPARTDTGRALVRQAAPLPTGGVGEVGAPLASARRRLDALGSVLGTGTPIYATLEERLLLAESSELRTNRQRQSYVDAVVNGIDAARRDIRMPGAQSITLTARRGEIPVTFQNRTGMPARVVVRVQSDKLDFPGGSSQTLDLARRNTTSRFSVVSRTSGAFPMRVVLESPDGNLVIGQARLTVRSTAASGISLVVSLGAAVFLAVWWGRHALRGRRARRLVAA
ncbi:MAG: DUF6049 family protein [Acidimicrobiales bacterium]